MRRMKFMALAAFILAAGVYAQEGGPPPGGFGHGPGPFGPGFGMRPGKVVTGAPYSATVTNQFTETLTDGNTIQRSTTAQVARDSSGRTYSQETITGGPFGSQSGPKTLTFISDPTAGYSYVLDASTKIAHRRPLRTPPTGNWPGRPPSEKTNPNVTVTSSTGTYQNLAVDIKTITRTIPAGTIGNANPIVSTTTTNYSPALQLVVYSTRDDPRSGHSIYALSNISTSEPAATLFTVPSDYTIQDDPRHERGGPHPGGGPGPGRRGPGGHE